ncbi:GIY-YIG nuclease family protein [Desulfobacter latus]|uniref:GIY-YIG nuclease family protein n=1 Tax=Desulfobacter latus TaxID=2292 RepID=A0A850SYN1_9BACT|nr:GIY-YIG nuclease family protein [Desulfobacter latus]NWH03811.1 GIY-YIG nuclease family protein [Desulfobacter latus]
MSKPGYVYILSNDAYQEDYYKIGMTSRSPSTRAFELYNKNTAVPGKFSVEFSIKVSDCALAERQIHSQLSTYRVNNYREFFKVPIFKARQVIIKVCEKIDQPRQKNAVKEVKSNSSGASFYRSKELNEQYIKDQVEQKRKLRLAAEQPNPTHAESLPKHVHNILKTFQVKNRNEAFQDKREVKECYYCKKYFQKKEGYLHPTGKFVCNKCEHSIVEPPDNMDSNGIVYAGFILFSLFSLFIFMLVLLGLIG